MKSNKAPGADGLTIEVVRTCWEWVGDDCVKMVRAVWSKKRILRADCEGLIKLLHKGGERKDLGNWRPISLMTLTYKIISKLLANRVRLVLPKLIDKQQTGFVMGRITDNVLSVKMGWATWTSQEGLAREGSARVHVNAAFTQEIKVGRGVRQGCPLAPLLYALCTQSFMALLCKASAEGKINGLFIQPGEMLGHQLFVDDTGICVSTKEGEFEELKGILRKYEMAPSGAKINLAKSLVMPLGSESVPQWVRGTGCRVAELGEVSKYLGVGIGVNLQEGAGIRIIIKRMRDRIFRWENAVLTWPARVVLLKHILSQIPTYQLLTLGCTKKEAKTIEGMCRDLLWGVSDQGKPKKALISWKRLTRPKSMGGLGILSFESRSNALQMRHAVDILNGEEIEWVWFRMKKRLHFLLEEEELPIDLPIPSLKQLWCLSGRQLHADFRAMEGMARNHHIKCLRDNGSVNLEHLAKLFPSGGNVRDSESEVCRWLMRIKIVEKPLTLVPGWRWVDSTKEYKGWKHSAKFWTDLQWGVPRSFKGLSGRWQERRNPEAWWKRWEFLWEGPSLFKQKIWIWRILNRAVMTASRAEKWKVADGVCPRCNIEKENVEHLFWECQKVRDRAEWVAAAVMGHQVGKPSLLQVLDAALKEHKLNPGKLMVVYEFSWQVWKERNLAVFEAKTQITSAWEMLEGKGRTARGVLKEINWKAAEQIRKNTADFLNEAGDCLRIAMSRQNQMRSILAEVTGWDGNSEVGGLLPRARVAEEPTEDVSSSSESEDTSESVSTDDN
ncbi:hypothetical protein R1sor_017452 [Riccia sorocarpa]|uniref:Reverse transcriptase zinc-binding domain-containing protein n=1 Tax=Riccia sorocarpa TaxID=122646 RepID=A0ABD3IAG9_9MARC